MNIAERLSEVVFTANSELFGERFGCAVEQCTLPIRCHVLAESRHAAQDYLAIISREDATIVEHDTGIDLATLEGASDVSHIDLVVYPAILPTLKEVFFRNPRFHLFADHVYVPERHCGPPALFTVGTTTRAFAHLLASKPSLPGLETCRKQRHERLKVRFGSVFLSDMDVVETLQSAAVQEIRLHGLGPLGTNIAQCCEYFTETNGLTAKTNIIIHGSQFEPLQYANLAASEVRAGVIPLHVECAVYYGLNELYHSRHKEIVFASHYYMPLDEMQLAARSASPTKPVDELRVASHPSPVSLARPLFEAGARYVKASSNADAAKMVRSGDADVCVTTGSAADNMNLVKIHEFGCPTMLFTVGASVDTATLRHYQQRSSHGASLSSAPRAHRSTPQA